MRIGLSFHATLVAAAISALIASGASAQQPLKIGLIVPMTGPFASTGKQVDAAVKLYVAEHGDVVAGRKIEVLLRDDTGIAPETTKRLAQELITNDHAEIIAGFGLTPLAFAAAPVATEAKTPMIVMAAGTLVIPSKSPYIVRTSFALPQQTAPIAMWAAKHGMKKVYTLVTDYGPGIDAENTFRTVFTASGGTVDSARVPLNNPDYAPFIQRAKDDKPDAVFIFVPSGEGSAVMKQFAERGLAKAGIKLIGTGDVVDDDILDSMGDPALGTITSHFYSAAHPSAENKAFVAAFEKANGGMRPNFMAVGGYDGMALIYKVLVKTGGSADGDKFIAAAKGMSWMSPRGKMTIDPETRDVIQDVYLRKVERVNGHLYNVEFDRVRDVHPDGK
ncbi:MAG: ABC transporter substrate-binding protein [Stellaceae bacterium]|jgi:branched-chain amino acid transport system substrate-binding protein